MTVSLVVISHSEDIARGTCDLAAQMAPGVALTPAGGTDDGRLGTSFDRIVDAIGTDAGDGVVLVCDIGSAVMTAETVLDTLDDGVRAGVVLADGPIVEGTVAGAVAAATGASLFDVSRAVAQAAGPSTVDDETDVSQRATGGGTSDAVTREITLVNEEGLHARPAAEFVKRASTFDAAVTVNGVDAKSLLGIMALGLAKGASAELSATGADANEAIDSLSAMVEAGFADV